MMERPSDILDTAADLTQREIESKLEEHRLRAAESSLKFNGFCYYCKHPLKESNFCDEDCRDDYEYEQKRKKANGV